MSTMTVDDGATIPKDPSDIAVYVFDWDTRNLGVGVTITSSNWAVSAVDPSTAPVPTLDQAAIISSSRQTRVRVTGGTAGALYALTNTIVTNETPAQTKERSVYLHLAQH